MVDDPALLDKTIKDTFDFYDKDDNKKIDPNELNNLINSFSKKMEVMLDKDKISKLV